MPKEKLDYKKLYLKQKKDNILLAGENQQRCELLKTYKDEIISLIAEKEKLEAMISYTKENCQISIGKYKSEIESLNNIMNIKMGNYHGALAVVEILAKNLK